MILLAVEAEEKKVELIEVPRKVLEFFPESRSQFHEDYKEWKSVRFIAGKTLSRGSNYHKALVLVQNGNRLQLRFYGWKFTKKGKWWHDQKFYFSVGTVHKLLRVLDGFQLYFNPEENQGEE